MPPWEHRWALCLMGLPYGYLLLLKYHINMMVFFPFNHLFLAIVQCLSSSWALIYFLIAYTKSNLLGWLLATFKANISFPVSMLEDRGLTKLEILSGEDMDFSLWWNSLDTKIPVSSSVELVEYMGIDAKIQLFWIPWNLHLLSCLFRLVPAQDVHFFYTRSHLSELQNCALIFSTNFQFIFTFKNALHSSLTKLCSAQKIFQ